MKRKQTYSLIRAPYGYRLDNGGLTVAPEEAEDVKKIFRMYLNGYGFAAIAKRMKREGANPTLWEDENISYILSNERYIGDCLLQKTYTPNILPLHSRPNHGELPKYYCENMQEAIISKENFAAAKALRESREKKQYKKKASVNNYFLRGKVRCRHCGWTYKKLMRPDGALYWTCTKKGMETDVCHAPAYSDEELRLAFVKMFNRIRQNEKPILDDTIYQLQMLKVKANAGNAEISEIDKELASLNEQNSLYSRLYAQGAFDGALYTEKTDKIKKRISDLRIRRTCLINENEEKRCIETLRSLKRTLHDASTSILVFDERLFNETVRCIYVEQDGGLTFALNGGLEFRLDSER